MVQTVNNNIFTIYITGKNYGKKLNKTSEGFCELV